MNIQSNTSESIFILTVLMLKILLIEAKPTQSDLGPAYGMFYTNVDN
jgi:hypothetical protein